MTTNLEALVGNRTRRYLELLMAIALLALGVQLTITPEEVFKPDGALELLMFAPPLLWTLLFVIAGTARIVVIIINGVWRPSPHVRWWLSLFTMLLWAAFASGYWSQLPATKGFPALVFGVVLIGIEALCLFALSALREGRRDGA